MATSSLADRMKAYEARESSRRLMPLLPMLARVDGKGFHRFCKGLQRPYDEPFQELMSTTAERLARATEARLAYTQSDEITLFWYADNPKSQLPFDGRIQKLVGELAALTSLIFGELLPGLLYSKADYPRPRFDARAWSVPTLDEAANVFLWREQDATRNSISMAAQHYYSHKQLMGKGGPQMQEMLHQKGVNWNGYPARFKRGEYFQRRTVSCPFTATEIDNLPPKHDARTNPHLSFDRQILVGRNMPPFGRVTNRVGVLLGEKPETEGQ